MAEGKLTIKQEKFCNKYLECGNASEAYCFAYGCKGWSDESVNVAASKLLKTAKVSLRVKQLQAQLAEKELITKEELIRLNVSIINADVLDFVDADMVDMQTEYGVRQVASISFQDLKSLPPEKRRLIQSIKIDRSGSPVVELMDKSKAIETINRMLGYNAPEKTANTDTKGNDIPQPTFNTDRFFQLMQTIRGND
jgi:hypothetical protein|nr:MAG TPA: Terminase small subunit [Caudoviricetes sp.]